jgi:MFS family permease
MMQSLLPVTTPGAQRDAQAAALASATVSLFTFGEFVTSVLWTKISDRIGRKPTLLIGAVGGCVSAGAFGLARSVPVAVGARLVGGLVNPNVGVVSVCVAEVVRNKRLQGIFFLFPFFLFFFSPLCPLFDGCWWLWPW